MSKTLNINGLCRCCLIEGEFRSLDAPYKFDGNDSYSALLLETFNITIRPMPGPDNASTYTICNGCSSRLQDAAQFRNRVLDCERQFAAYYLENYLRGGPDEGNDYDNEFDYKIDVCDYEKSKSLRQHDQSDPDNTRLKLPCGVKRRNTSSIEVAVERIDNNDIELPPKRAYEPPPAKPLNVIAEKLNENAKEYGPSHHSPPVEIVVKSEPLLKTTPPTRRPSPSETVMEPSSRRPNPFSIGRPTPAVRVVMEESYVEPLISASIDGVPGKVTRNLSVPEYGHLITNTNPQNNPTLQKIGAISANEETAVLKEMKTEIRKINENQYQLFKLQNTMLEKMFELSTKFDVLFSQLKTETKGTNEDNTVKPISNITELNELKKKLEVPDSKDQLFRRLSLVCRKGLGNGITNAYALIDALFDRTFITQCSWTGLSKGDASKYCFKSLTEIIDFFFEIVHQSDETFTKIDCHKFLKTVLRNAQQRCKSQVRMSTQRRKLKPMTQKGVHTLSTGQHQENPSIQSDEIEEESSNPGRDVEALPDVTLHHDV